MLTTLLFALEIKFVLKIESNAWVIKWILYNKTNREALTVLCSSYKALWKRLEHSRSGKKHLTTSCVSPYTSFVLF